MSDESRSDLIPSGVEGLDEVLRGGLVANRMYVLEGRPGSGKTTVALQFLQAGAARGEPSMFVTLSETESDLRASARSHGWSLDGIRILELIASEESLAPDARYTMYHPSEVELGETTKSVLAEADRLKPVRLVFDSLSELRLLSENTLRYRREILAFKQFFSRLGTTVIFVDDRTGQEQDMHLHSLAHGVISLERDTADYGSIRRRIQVHKLRGRSFREGFHDFQIRTGGVVVFPRLVAAEHRGLSAREPVGSGVESMDALLGGGISRGTSTLLIGAAGTGKSVLATQYARAAAERGEHATYFLFDESIATFTERASGLKLGLDTLVEKGRLDLRQVDPAEMSPGEFVHSVREAVEMKKTRLLVIDSLSGYLNAMPSERFLNLHLHELLTYLGQKGVITLLVMTQHGLVGPGTEAPVDASYLADTVLLLRYFEARGELRQAISVIKKRTGSHERTIREVRIEAGSGITLGRPVRGLQGVLSWSPEFVDGVSHEE